jgi:MFS family permease
LVNETAPQGNGAYRQPPGRAAHVLSQLYYYIGAVAGVALLIGGLISALIGLRMIAFPREFEGTRDGLRAFLHGLGVALPGAITLLWHLPQARRREGKPYPEAFWGRSLYFHLVALVSLGFLLGGAVVALNSLIDAVMPQCFTGPVEPLEVGGIARECIARSEGLRNAVDGLIVVLVAGPVWFWHLREGRKATAPL